MDELKQQYANYQWFENTDSFSKATVYHLKNKTDELYLKTFSYYEEKVVIEKEVLTFLSDKLNVPTVLATMLKPELSYITLSAVKGNNLRSQLHLLTTDECLKILADGLKNIHNLDITDCNIMAHATKVANQNIPKNDLVFIHGDYCPVNIIVDKKQIGFVDFGQSGIGDRYYDLAEICFIIEKHFGETAIPQFLKLYGINNLNHEKLAYYTQLFHQLNP